MSLPLAEDRKDYYESEFNANLNRLSSREFGNIDSSFRYFSQVGLEKSARILDVGTNIGSLLKRMDEAGWKNAFGVDISSVSIAWGKEVYPELQGKLRSYSGNVLPYEDATFDCVTAFDVIEHIPEVLPFLNEIARVLKPDGRFVFQTPNRIPNLISMALECRSREQWKEMIYAHCSLQTVSSLKQILKAGGFSEVTVEKSTIVTDFNINKMRRLFGPGGPYLLRLLDRFPLSIFPNLFGYCRKAAR